MKKFLSLTIFFLCISFGLPHISYATEVYFSSPVQDFKTGDKIYFDVFVDPDSENINALEMDLVFPGELLEFVDYYDTGSIINGWVEVPAVSGNSIRFAGIVAGGFSGLIDPVTNDISSGRVTRLVFVTKKEGSGSLSFTSSSVFKNDGLGTPLSTNTLPYEFSVSNDAVEIKDFSFDNTPPEIFSPLIKRDERFFEGKYFVVFEAKDKETGIAYYRIKEGLRKWTVAKSPYLLQDQSLRSTVKIVAVDKNGNEREARITLDDSLSNAGLGLLVTLILILCAVIIFAYVYLKKKK